MSGGLVLGLALGLAGVATAQRSGPRGPESTRSRPRRRASAAPWSGSSRCSRRTRAAAPPSTASTATTSSAARSTPSSSRIATASPRDPKDGTAWLILGLLEFQRGQDAAAVTALRQAETTRPDDPLPPYYLGQALVLVGQPEQAAAAFERALEAQAAAQRPARDLPGARTRLPAHPEDRPGPPVWNRLEALFPDDPRVQEQIASALAEENQPAAGPARASRRWPRSVTDPFRQVQLAMQAADLKVRLGRSERGSPRLRGACSPSSGPIAGSTARSAARSRRSSSATTTRPASSPTTRSGPRRSPRTSRPWSGWAGPSPAWAATAEAQAWYEKAIKLAPSRRDLRLALIAQLVQDQKFAEAAAQYEALDQAEPNNPDTLRDWGALVLRDTTKPQAERKAAAAAIWRKLLEAKPNDPVTTAQVADLFRQAELVDDALALYRKAIELAPSNPQYHEYLGEYLHNLKRPDEAKAAWAKIADGPNRNAKNLARLAEVLAGFGYVKEAIAPADRGRQARARRLRPATQAGRATRIGSSGTTTPRPSSPRRQAGREGRGEDAVLEARVKNDQAAGRLAAADRGAAQGAGRRPGTRRPRAGACWPATSRPTPSSPRPSAPPTAPIEVDPRSIPAWTLAARLRESAGNLGDAADAFRRLAEIDRRNRTEHLTGIAKLEARLGRIDAALKAGRDLLAAAPGNPEQLRVLRPALLPARPVRGGARRPAPRGAGQPQRHQDHRSPWPRPSPASTAPTRRSRCTGGPSTRPRTSTTSSASSAG